MSLIQDLDRTLGSLLSFELCPLWGWVIVIFNAKMWSVHEKNSIQAEE